ncbi:hypothetical protein B566_EDAN007201 [Ephemera danica]|nr:hypothetical protein B566_EDAN007201 [Ephemera danica]
MSLSLLLLCVACGAALLQDQQQHWWLLQTPPATPCPTVFSYQQEAEQWVGLVIAPPPRPTDNNLTLKLTVTLTNKFIGRVDLREDKGVVASRLREGNTSPVQYRVWFPLQSPLPHIIAVQLNDRVLCQQQLPAAHCVGQPGEYLTPNKLLVYLGKHDMRKWTEPQSQPREVAQIVIHPGHRPDIRKEVDLAILVLAIPVVRSASVQPVCLWFPSNPSVRLDLEPGTVVGWGRDEKGNRVSDEPRQLVMPLATQEECLRSHRDFLYLTSENTFCAGGRDGSGPCSGDSGGGMYTSEPQSDGTTRWMLRGVVSQSLLDATTHQCDLKNFVVFTDAVKHATWIRMVVENT